MANQKKEIQLKEYTVIKAFTLEKQYKVGSKISLPDGKIKHKLISNKFIK